MKFPYLQYKFATVERPIIPIRVEIDGQSLRYDVLVDSGADINVFDLAVAEALGINPEAGRKETLVGVTGVAQNFFFHDIVLHVGTHRIITKAGFAELPGSAYGVVGQRGFFDHFKVTFNQPIGELELVLHKRT